MVQHIQPTKTGFLVQESIGVRTRLRHLDASAGQLSTYEPRERRLAISGFSHHGGAVVFSASHANHPAELFVSAGDGEGSKARRLTRSNADLEGRAFGQQRVVKYRTRDGLMVEGL